MKRAACIASLVLAIAAGPVTAARAADPEECRAISLSDPGWTDITSTNAVATLLLEALGYAPEVKILSVPIGYEGMKSEEVDVFLGNWMPIHEAYRKDLDAAAAVEVLATNLTGAKLTLAVPDYVAAAGVTDFANLGPNADKFDSTIYGIEAGAGVNAVTQGMIDADGFGLAGWKLAETGEQAMLAQVDRAVSSEDWIVFIAWEPHPMNTVYDITYLTGGDAYYGPNFGGAEVFTLARTGWAEACPNAAQLFRNLKFELDMENEMMGRIIDGEDPADAAAAWLEANPDVLGPWLEGVTTFDGQPGLPAVQAALGL
jgi:glycine betaine/proline transport system substrate-binding protein